LTLGSRPPDSAAPDSAAPDLAAPDLAAPDLAAPDLAAPDGITETSHHLAREAIGLLISAGQTVAAAESLTGGLVAAALTSVPGSSAVFRGGIVAYATELKADLLGVPADLLARHGPVDADVAAAMAAGARKRLGAAYGLATTGVAGPGPADGRQAGTVFIAVLGPSGLVGCQLKLAGDRPQVREQSVREIMSLLVRTLREDWS
jgi:nicotinamide-nucleotide amidase